MATAISEKQKLIRKTLTVERILTKELCEELLTILERDNKFQSNIEARRVILQFMLQHFHETENQAFINRLELIAHDQNALLLGRPLMNEPLIELESDNNSEQGQESTGATKRIVSFMPQIVHPRQQK